MTFGYYEKRSFDLETGYNFAFTKHVGVEMLKKLVVLVIVFFVIVSCVGQKGKNTSTDTNTSKQQVAENNQSKSWLETTEAEDELNMDKPFSEYVKFDDMPNDFSDYVDIVRRNSWDKPDNERDVSRLLHILGSDVAETFDNETSTFKRKDILETELPKSIAKVKNIPRYFIVPIGDKDTSASFNDGNIDISMAIQNGYDLERLGFSLENYVVSEKFSQLVALDRKIRYSCSLDAGVIKIADINPYEFLSVQNENIARTLEELSIRNQIAVRGFIAYKFTFTYYSIQPTHFVYGIFDKSNLQKNAEPIYAVHYKRVVGKNDKCELKVENDGVEFFTK